MVYLAVKVNEEWGFVYTGERPRISPRAIYIQVKQCHEISRYMHVFLYELLERLHWLTIVCMALYSIQLAGDSESPYSLRG